MKKLILLCLSILLSQYTFAENWKLIIQDDDGSFYLDTDRVIKQNKSIQYWAKFVADVDNEELDMKKGDYTLSQNIDQCDTRTTHSTLVENYLKNGQLLSREPQDDEIYSVDDDKADLAFFKTVCK